jgi:hypothetical protein
VLRIFRRTNFLTLLTNFPDTSFGAFRAEFNRLDRSATRWERWRGGTRLSLVGDAPHGHQ